jgi:tetratricopeptide (TPR) repeat protein
MNIVEKIKSLLQEAELYRSQSLLNESKVKYETARDLIEKNEQLKGREKILASLLKKLDSLNAYIEKVEKADQNPELSADVQEIIKAKFAFTTNKEEGALEGAMALAKFGQHKAALKEFNELIKIESNRIVAAKNIVRCHISLETYGDIVKQHQEWASGELFSADQLENLRVFINSMLSKKGVENTIPPPEGAPTEIEAPELEVLELEVPEIETAGGEPPSIEIPGIEIPGIEMPGDDDHGLTAEDLDDVNAIGITLEEGPLAGKLVELEISFHSGTELTVIIPEKEKEMADILKPGYDLKDVQFYTPFAMLAGDCQVESNTKIGTGPKRGDFSLDLRVKTG